MLKLLLVLLVAHVGLTWSVYSNRDTLDDLSSEYLDGNVLDKRHENGDGNSGNVNFLILQELFTIKTELRTTEENLLDKMTEFETTAKTRDKKMGKLEEELSLVKRSNEKLLKEINLFTSSVENLTKKVDSTLDETKTLVNSNIVQSKRLEKLSLSDEAQSQEVKDLRTNLTVLEDGKVREDQYIVDNICKSRSVNLPSGCSTGECCLMHMVESFDKCLPKFCTGKCPSGYSFYSEGAFCYKFHRACKSWNEARKVCKSEGADLVILKGTQTVEDFKQLVKQEAKYGGCSANGHWVGATDEVKEGVWKWVDGSLAELSSFWGSREPNGGTRENCANFYAVHKYMYNDAPCGASNYYSFICGTQ